MSTIHYVIILAFLADSLVLYFAFALRRTYRAELREAWSQPDSMKNPEILTETDIAHLPEPIQRYLRYTNVIGKEKVRNFRLVGEGLFRMGPDKDWVKARAEQVSFIDHPRRLYFMKLILSGIPVVGLHVYKQATATMRIKVAGLITVGDAKGDIMNKAETVTVFNDMCLMAPASLIDPRIEWETIDALTVKGTFSHAGIRISAQLIFNENGELINFISHDRAMTASGDTYRSATWSTPVGSYQTYNGIRLASYGEAHWHLPEGDFCYGKITLKDVKYNIGLREAMGNGRG